MSKKPKKTNVTTDFDIDTHQRNYQRDPPVISLPPPTVETAGDWFRND